MSAIREITITPPIPGAGRVLDVAWPSPENVTSGTTLRSNVVSRQSPMTNGLISVATAGAGTTFATVYRGRVAHAMHADGVSAAFCGPGSTLQFTPNVTVGGPAGQGDFAVWRVVGILAVDTPGGVGDLGIECTINNTLFDVLNASAAGFGFRMQTNATVRFIARRSNLGPLTVDDTFPVADVRDYNAYEMRLVSATRTTPAFVRALINNRQVATYPFDGATLPDGSVFRVGIGNRGSTNLYLPLCGARIMAGPTEAATL